MGSDNDRLEFVFFDVETTIPMRKGQSFAILEFGAILVDHGKLVELESYSTLVRPADLSLINSSSIKCNGITRDDVKFAPTFRDVSGKIFDLLHGRIWAGHNILRFDCLRINEAFFEIGHPAPEPRGLIDSLVILRQKFGRRAGDMKMASLASYFNLGPQAHRSLDDARMNLEVVKYCATVLFLESCLPEIFADAITHSSTARSHEHNISLAEPMREELDNTYEIRNEEYPTTSTSQFETSIIQPNPFDMEALTNELRMESVPEVAEESNEASSLPSFSSLPQVSEEDSVEFLPPDRISVTSISASLIPFYNGIHRSKLLHKSIPLKLFCTHMRVIFGLSMKYIDHAGKPRLSFVASASPNLCRVIDACDEMVQKLFMESGSPSEWRPTVIRKNGFMNYPTVRLNMPTIGNGCNTEIYQKEIEGSILKLVSNGSDAVELREKIVPGIIVDVYFGLDVYDYQQNAGIRLVAKRLIINHT